MSNTPSTPATALADDLEVVAVLAKSLADANRLRILQCLSRGEQSVTQIVEQMALSQPLVSHHLKELKRALLVRTQRRGPFIWYRLADDRILPVVDTLRTVARDLINARISF